MSEKPDKPQPRPTLKAVRGTRDLLPDQTPLWNHVESTARAVFSRYGFGEIRTPIFEATELFSRGVGEETDIVSKEMFTWEDGGRAELTRLEFEWLLINGDRIKGLISHDIIPVPTPQVFKTVVLDGIRTFVEFRVFPPTVPDTELIQRATSLLQHNVRHLVVVPRSKIDALKQNDYKTFRIFVEDVPGKFITSDQSLTLRPENTAGVVRAYIEHKLGGHAHIGRVLVGRPADLRHIEKAEDVQAMVHRHLHHIVVPRHLRPLVRGQLIR